MLKPLFLLLATLFSLIISADNALAEQRLSLNGREIKGWLCNGHELKPKIGATAAKTWIFDGPEIKPKLGASAANTWIYDGKELKPKMGATSANTWNVGSAPILVIAGALVLHL